MKFYIEMAPLFKAQRRAHIAKDGTGSGGKCLCLSQLNPERWVLVETLPEDIHLCKKCSWLAENPVLSSTKFTRPGD